MTRYTAPGNSMRRCLAMSDVGASLNLSQRLGANLIARDPDFIAILKRRYGNTSFAQV